MSKNTNINKKGATNVKKVCGKNTAMYDKFDLNDAEIKRSGQGDWNDFEINDQEGKVVKNSGEPMTKKMKQKILYSHVGRMVLKLGPSLKLAA